MSFRLSRRVTAAEASTSVLLTTGHSRFSSRMMRADGSAAARARREPGDKHRSRRQHDIELALTAQNMKGDTVLAASQYQVGRGVAQAEIGQRDFPQPGRQNRPRETDLASRRIERDAERRAEQGEHGRR